MGAASLGIIFLGGRNTIVRRNITIAMHKVLRLGFQRCGSFRAARFRARFGIGFRRLSIGDGNNFHRRIGLLHRRSDGRFRLCRLRSGRLVRFTEELRDGFPNVEIRRKVAKPCHRIGVGEVPIVFRETLEVADGGVRRPRASKRRTGQFHRHTR